jgi:glutathione S-transferase
MSSTAPATLGARPVILADHGCPFAHRALALLDHLGVAHELRATPRGQLPEGLRQVSPSGRLPMLVHGELAIGESRVMLEHLAEAYGFAGAYPAGLVERSLHRQALALVDSLVAPRLFHDPGAPDPRLTECLDVIEALARSTPPEPSLLAFHVAPIWQRLQWWQPDGGLTCAIRTRPTLAGWLDRTAGLPPVVRTSPRRDENVAAFRAATAALAG